MHHIAPHGIRGSRSVAKWTLILSATTLSRGDRFAGQFVNSCTKSGCSPTVRAFLVFERRTSNVAESLR